MSKWQTEHHFVSWLRLCPDNKVSGDKIIGKGRLPTNNRITNTLKMAASSLRSALLSGPASRRVLFHPCASLSLYVHHVVKRTFTSMLSIMLGTQKGKIGCS